MQCTKKYWIKYDDSWNHILNKPPLLAYRFFSLKLGALSHSILSLYIPLHALFFFIIKHLIAIHFILSKSQYTTTMSSSSRAWMVAGTVGLVEALKDQGFARWNYAIRTIHHHAKSNLRSISHTRNLSSPAAMASTSKSGMEDKINQSEESLRKVMYLSCWGPN